MVLMPADGPIFWAEKPLFFQRKNCASRLKIVSDNLGLLHVHYQKNLPINRVMSKKSGQ